MTARRPFRGWWVVAGLFVVLAVSSGLGFYGTSVYKDALSDELGFSETAVSMAVAVQFLASGSVGLLVARMIGRHDVRRVMVVGALVGGTALFLVGSVDELWQIYVLFALFGAGFSAAGLVPATTVVTRWFTRRRSVALSVTSTGLSLGGIAVTPLAAHLIDSRGLSDAMPVLGIIFIVGIVPVTWLLVRPDPEAVGQSPDGEPTPASGRVALTGTPYHDAIRSPFFIRCTTAYVIVMLAQVGGIAHLFSAAKDRVDSDTAALTVSVLAGTSVVARLVGGWIAERVRLRALTVSFAILQMAGLVLISQADTRTTILLSAAVFGSSVGNLLMLQPLLLAEAFGVVDYPRIYALGQMFTTIGVAGGPALMGAMFDVTDGWQAPYLLAALSSGVAAALLATTLAERYAPNVAPTSATASAPANPRAASAT
jgi:MFS family permease